MAGLEKLQHASVDSTLDDIRRMLASKSLFFSKNVTLDFLLNLKMVVKKTKHSKAGLEKVASPTSVVIIAGSLAITRVTIRFVFHLY